MNFSPFKVLQHVAEAFNGSYTIFQHKANENELFILREEIAKTDEKYRASLEHLAMRRKATSPHLLKIFKIDASLVRRQFHVMLEYSLHNLTKVHLRSFDSVMKCLLDVLKGLADLDSLGMYHGDITCENILYFPKLKMFKLSDRVFPLASPFSYFRSVIDSNRELFMSPKLFNDTINKSVRSLKTNFAKNDVFSIGMIALKLLYPFVVKVEKFYSRRNKLFDTFEFMQLMDRLIKTAKTSKETDFLNLLKKKFVCFDDAQRAIPRIALSEFQTFLKNHYPNFEGTFLSQNIIIESADKNSEPKISEPDQSPALFGPRLTFQKENDFKIDIDEKQSSKFHSGNNQQPRDNQEASSVLSKSNVQQGDYESGSRTSPMRTSQPFGRNSHFEKIIDFEELQSQTEANQIQTGDKGLKDSLLSDPHGSKIIPHAEEIGSLSKDRNETEMDQLYEVLVKIDVRKLKTTDKPRASGRLIDLKDYSKFSLNFQNEQVRIKSKSANIQATSKNPSKFEDYSYDSINEKPLNLNFVTRKSNPPKRNKPQESTQKPSIIIQKPSVIMADARPKTEISHASPVKRIIQGNPSADSRSSNAPTQIYQPLQYRAYAPYKESRPPSLSPLPTATSTRMANYLNSAQYQPYRVTINPQTKRIHIKLSDREPHKTVHEPSTYTTFSTPLATMSQFSASSHRAMARVVKRISIEDVEGMRHQIYSQQMI
jgi:hypothetical protein